MSMGHSDLILVVMIHRTDPSFVTMIGDCGWVTSRGSAELYRLMSGFQMRDGSILISVMLK